MLEMVDLVNQGRRKKATVMVVLNHVTSRSALAGYIRDELSSSGARVLKAEVTHRAVFSEAELFKRVPHHMGKRAIKAAAEITAITNEIIRT